MAQNRSGAGCQDLHQHRSCSSDFHRVDCQLSYTG